MESINSKCYVLGDHINTDNILVAEYMKLNPGIPEEYEKLGSLAMSGLPDNYPPFIGDNGKSLYKVIIAGENFGCGSSREHAVIALEASGVNVIIAKSFARIFYRNCLNTGKVLVLETTTKVIDQLITGDEVKVDLCNYQLKISKNNRSYELKSLPNEVREIFSKGGLYNYARSIGKINK